MQWSKIKTRMKEFVCPELQDRVDFHMTRFPEAHDQVGRAWVTIDGVEVLDCSFYRRLMVVVKERDALMKDKACGEDYIEKYCASNKAGHKKADTDFIFDEDGFRNAILAYLDISIKDAVVSENPLIEAFALIDRHWGKRTFEKIRLSENAHPLVHAFYELRSHVFNQFAFSHN
jgi:hypothetical protein